MTTTTTGLIQTIRTALYDFQATSSGSVSASCGDRLYINQPPDNVTYPFIVMRLTNQETLPEFNGDKETATLEVQIFGKVRGDTTTLEKTADFCDGAMLRYVNSTSGMIFSRGRLRDMIQPIADPADREVVQIRLAYNLHIWPVFLTQYSGSV